ncbi:MAG: hypothetical protein Tsb0020_07420 [Haliangiales bacterium]
MGFSPPTLEQLLDIVYRHYPRGVANDDSRRSDTDEERRLVCVQEAAAHASQWEFYDVPDAWRMPIAPQVASVIEALSAWRSLAEEWARKVPEYPLWDESNPWHDACYQYAVVQAGYSADSDIPPDRVVAAVSILAPVYTLCHSGAASQSARVEKITEFIERYLGFTRIPDAALRTPLPDIVPGSSNLLLGQATLRDCLFSALLCQP